MYTRCTHCETWFAITADQLRQGKGEVRCGRCMQPFDALRDLYETIPRNDPLGGVSFAPFSADPPLDAPPAADPSGAGGTELGRGERDALTPERRWEDGGPPEMGSPIAADAAVGSPESGPRNPSPPGTADRTEALPESSIADDGFADGGVRRERTREPALGDFRLLGGVAGRRDGRSATEFVEDERDASTEPGSGPGAEPPPLVGARHNPPARAPDALPLEDSKARVGNDGPELSLRGPSDPENAAAVAADDFDRSITTSDESGAVEDDEVDEPEPKAAPARSPLEPAPPEIPIILREDVERWGRARRNRWVQLLQSIAVALLLTLLVAQYAWWSPQDLVRRYPLARPWLDTFCARAGCELPHERDPSRIRLVGRDVRIHPRYEGALLVTASLVNAAPFVQPFPEVEFTLYNVNGQTIAARRFQPREYLGRDVDAAAGMQPEHPVQIVLDLLAPEEAAVSFEFRFI